MKRIPKQEYTAEFKEQAVKRADEIRSIGRVAEELGLVEQTLRNWIKAAKAGKLNPAGAKQITAEQMELSRLRAQVARLKMELEITKKSFGIFREGSAVKYAWIETQRRSSPLPVLCDALLRRLIEQTFAALTAEEVIARLDAADIANAHASTMNDIWTHPQLKARKRWTTVDSPVGPLPALQPPAMGGDHPARMDPVPALGGHTDVILAQLGYGHRIGEIHKKRVV